MKKVLTYLLSVVMVAALSIAGTLAYLKDEDSDVNVMTMGNVYIKQHEYERTVDENGDYEKIDVDSGNGYQTKTYNLQGFNQNKCLYPAVYNSNEFSDGDYDSTMQYWALVGSQGASYLFPKEVKNVLDKFVLVENTGTTNAYVRTVFAFEQANFTKDQLFNEIIKINRNESQWKWNDIGTAKIEGTNYYIITATYKGTNAIHVNGELKPNEVTFPSLLQVMMYNTVENEDVQQFGNEYKIYTVSQAVQANGFDNATEALNTAFGKITKTNHPWAENQ